MKEGVASNGKKSGDRVEYSKDMHVNGANPLQPDIGIG